MDKKKYRKRLLLELCTRPLTLLPAVGGTSLLIGSWALGQSIGPLPFMGLLGVLAGIGTFMSSVLTGGGKTAKKVAEEMKSEEQALRQQALDDLEQRLMEDGDPRTEQALRDLRELAQSLAQEEVWSSLLSTHSGFAILSDVDRLFETSVSYLEKTLEIWHTAQGIQQPRVRETLLEQRTHLIREVQGSVDHLGDVLTHMQTLRTGAGSRSDLQQLRDELDQNLEIARRVDERMTAWETPEWEHERE